MKTRPAEQSSVTQLGRPFHRHARQLFTHSLPFTSEVLAVKSGLTRDVRRGQATFGDGLPLFFY